MKKLSLKTLSLQVFKKKIGIPKRCTLFFFFSFCCTAEYFPKYWNPPLRSTDVTLGECEEGALRGWAQELVGDPCRTLLPLP